MQTQRVPLPRKRATPRAWKTPRCIYETPTGRHPCRKPQQHIERCRPHADLYLDGLVRDILMAQFGAHCQVDHPFPCSDALQVNHGIDRGEKSVRWNLDNVVRGCSALNLWAFQHRVRWQWMFADFIGAERYAALQAIVLDPPKLDYDAVLAELTARKKEMTKK